MTPCFISLFFCCFISQFLFLFHVNVSSVSFPVSSHCVFCCFISQFLLFLFLFYFPGSNAHAWDKLPSSVPASSSHSPFLLLPRNFSPSPTIITGQVPLLFVNFLVDFLVGFLEDFLTIIIGQVPKLYFWETFQSPDYMITS